MAETRHPNWEKLSAIGSNIEEFRGYRHLEMKGLPYDLAIRLAVELTFRLDRDNGIYRPTTFYNGSPWNFGLERSLRESYELLTRRKHVVFGEERPADRNMAVRVEHDATNDTFALIVDVRNELEDKRELDGGSIIKRCFEAAVEAVEF